jgi:hypothetical protein
MSADILYLLSIVYCLYIHIRSILSYYPRKSLKEARRTLCVNYIFNYTIIHYLPLIQLTIQYTMDLSQTKLTKTEWNNIEIPPRN